MQADNFQLDAYFHRIGFSGRVEPTLETVSALMRCQLFSVPFENLDVQAGKIVSLVPEQIVDKIIHRQRGGYCYEVNGLFAMALQAIGIPYQFVAARPMIYPVRRPRTHMAIIAQVDGGEWLCDLGFGSYGIRMPMSLGLLGTEVRQDFDTFMLSAINDREYLLQAWVKDAWMNQYAFDLWPQEWIDFAPANYLNSTHPDAIFVQKRLIVLHRPTGRDMLVGDRLTRIERGRSITSIVEPGGEHDILRELFGLRV